jgi:dihydroorotate dehydrogenase (NAD+) catalytic subunit
MIDLSTVVCGIKLENPTMLASGILGETGKSLLRAARNGAGAVVTKSIGKKALSGYANPTVIEVENGLLNAMGLPNPGIEEYRPEVKIALSGSVPVIGSIFGGDVQEFTEVAKKMESYGVHALELNMSCPHVKGYGTSIGQSADSVFEVTKEVKRKIRIPVFVKLTPNVTDIVGIAKAVEEAGGNAVVAINTVKAMNIDIDAKIPALSNKIGGYSGRGIKPIGVRCVYEIAQEVHIPIIGVGGVLNGRDALEYLMAGAVAVQIGSGVHYRGICVFKEVCKEINNWMKKHKYKKTSDIIGIAQKR